MTDANRSPIAQQVVGVRDPSNGWERGKPFGLLLHTTGGGVTDLAKKHGQQPIDVAIRVYIGSQNGDNGYLWGGPHYVIPHDGSIHQLAPDNLNMQHAGGRNRLRYFDGSWESKFPTATERWKNKWAAQGYRHPYGLFPSTSPNHDYIGVEMIPCGDGFGAPRRPGLRFTQAQHDAAIKLGHDCAMRHGWGAAWRGSSRLVGHEDVDPLERSDVGGGWDPGFLRPSPYFDFDYVRGAVELPT